MYLTAIDACVNLSLASIVSKIVGEIGGCSIESRGWVLHQCDAAFDADACETIECVVSIVDENFL